jgi:copper(I)-binding protein
MKLPAIPTTLRLLLLAAILSALPAAAQSVKVANAWARATVPGQNTGAAYFEITSSVDAVLTAAGSPAAARTVLHTMSMEGGVMRMRPLERVELPAGKTVKLAPGGMHLMLEELRQPLKAGDRLPLVLSVQPSGMSLITVNVQAEVRPISGAQHNH